MKNWAKIIDVACFQHKTFNQTALQTTWHQHRSVEVLYVINGTIQVEYTDASGQNSIQFIYPREFIVIAPNVNHTIHILVENTSIYEVELLPFGKSQTLFDLILSIPFFADNKRLYNIINSMSITKFKDKVDISSILQQLVLLLDNKYKDNTVESDMFDIDFSVLLYRLLASICHCKTLPEQSKNNLHINHIITFIKNNYDKDITVKSIANLFQLSTSYLQTLFKSEMGVNIMTYVNDIRFERALTLMQENTHELKDIALLCGFKTYRNFYNNFIKRYKTTPTEYILRPNKEIFTVLVDLYDNN